MSTDSGSDAQAPPRIVARLPEPPPELLRKVLFAGVNKNFIGTGRLKLSKQEIKGLNIDHLAQEVLNRTNRESFRNLSQYTFGLCRIYEKAVDFLLEDLQRIDAALNEQLDGSYEALKKSKKPKKGKKDKNQENEENFDAESIRSPQLCEEGYLVDLFRLRDETDRHLLQECENRIQETDTLGLFGDEIHLPGQAESYDTSLQRFAQMDQEMQAFLGNDQLPHQIVVEAEIHDTPAVVPSETHQDGGTEAGGPDSPGRRTPDVPSDSAAPERSIASTPKRKTRKPHDDTPKKRQRQYSPSQPDAASNEKSPVPRRLFGRDDQSSVPADEEIHHDEDEHNIQPVEQSSTAPANENILDGETQNASRPFDERMPLPAINEEARRISAQITGPDTVQGLEQDREQPPAEGPELDQHLPDESLQSDDIELEQLNDESIAALPPNRRKRPKEVIDKKKNIQREIDITDLQNEKYVTLYTEDKGAIRLEKQISSKNLFLMPAVGLKPGGSSSYGARLLNLYRERARSLLDFTHDDVTLPRSPLPRDAHVNKRPRFSSFGRGSRPRVSASSTPAGEPNVQVENDDGYHADPDRELMPPPKALPTPALPPLSREPSPQPQAPGTPTRRTEPDTSAASPRRPLIPQIHITEPVTGDEPPAVHSDLPDDQQDLNAIQGPADDSDPRVLENPDVVAMSPRSTASERERRTLMKENEFTRFIESLWHTGVDIVDLEDIIPRGATVIAFHRYFTFLQKLQRNRKLSMEQEVIYGPVNIVRDTDEQEDQI